MSVLELHQEGRDLDGAGFEFPTDGGQAELQKALVDFAKAQSGDSCSSCPDSRLHKELSKSEDDVEIMNGEFLQLRETDPMIRAAFGLWGGDESL